MDTVLLREMMDVISKAAIHNERSRTMTISFIFCKFTGI